MAVHAAIEGTQGLPPAASGAFLPERTRDQAYQGATYPYLDNPGRVPGADSKMCKAMRIDTLCARWRRFVTH